MAQNPCTETYDVEAPQNSKYIVVDDEEANYKYIASFDDFEPSRFKSSLYTIKNYVDSSLEATIDATDYMITKLIPYYSNVAVAKTINFFKKPVSPSSQVEEKDITASAESIYFDYPQSELDEFDIFYDASSEYIGIYETIPSKINSIFKYDRICAQVNDVIQDASMSSAFVADKVKQTTEKIKHEALEFLHSDFINRMSIPDIDTIYDWLTTLKPINLGCFYQDIVNSKCKADRLVVVTRLMEMYDLFWTDELHSFKTMIIGVIVEVINYFFHNDEVEHQGFTPTGDTTIIVHFLKFFGILPPQTLNETWIYYACAVLGVFFLCTGGVFKKFSLSPDQLIKQFKKSSTVIKSAKIMYDDLPTVFASVLNDVGSLFGFAYMSDSDKEVQQFREDLLNFKKEVMELNCILNTEPTSLLTSQDKVLKVKSTLEDMDALYDRMLKQKANTSVCKPILDELRPLVKAINSYCEKSRTENCTKIEPFLVVITGAPGIGKSKLINSLIKSVAAEIREQHPELSHLSHASYVRNSGEKFWSGYVGQPFVVYDDFGQVKQDPDHLDVMLVKNPNRTILQMADVAEKGRQFSSIGIFAAANEVSTSTSSVIKSVKALGRRMEIHIYAHDPNFVNFKASHNDISPGDYEKSTGTTAMINDRHGNPIPYFDKQQFTHLSMFKCPGDAPRTVENTIEMNFQGIVDMCCKYFNHYYNQYIDSQIPKTNAEVYQAFDRVSVSSDDVIKAFEAAPVKEMAEQIVQKQLIAGKVTQTVRAMWNDFDAPEFLPSVDEAKAWKDQQVFKDTGAIPKNNYVPSMEYVRHQAADEVESAARSYLTVSQKKGKTIMLLGEPGTGKSTIIKEVMQLCAEGTISCVYGTDVGKNVVTSPVLYIEDATVTKEAWEKTVEVIMKQEDGFNDYQLVIVSANPQCLATYMDMTTDVWTRIRRRCEIFTFSFSDKRKSKFFGLKSSVKYTPKDLTQGVVGYDQAINILNDDRKPEFRQNMVEYLKTSCEDCSPLDFSRTICRSVPYMTKAMYTPDFIVKFNADMYETFKMLYDDPSQILRSIATGTVKILKGSVIDGYKVASQFQSAGERADFPATLKQFIVIINNSGWQSKIPFVTEIQCNDYTVVIMPKPHQPNLINCFMVCDDLTFSNGKFMDSENNSMCANVATMNRYSDYLEVAQAVNRNLPEALSSVESTCANSLGLTSLTQQFPIVDRMLKILVFSIKVYSGWKAVSMYASRYVDPVIQERSKEKRTLVKKRRAANHRAVKEAVKINKQQYDTLRDLLDSRGNTAAKRKGLMQLLVQWGDNPFDEDGYVDEEFEDWIEYATFESGEKSSPKEQPKIEIIPGVLEIESGEKNSPKEEPRIITDPTTFLFEQQEEKVAQPIRLDRAIKAEQIAQRFAEAAAVERAKMQGNVVHESALDPSLRAIVKLARSNTVEIGSVIAGEFTFCVSGLMVGEKYGVTVLHAVGPTTVAQIWNNDRLVTYPLTILRKYTENDLVVFQIQDVTCPRFRNITAHIPSKKCDFKKTYDNTFGVISTLEDDCNLLRSVKLGTQERIIVNDKELDLLSYVGYVQGIVYRGPILTQAGDCGSPVIANDISVQQKILAIHSAANKTIGYGAMLCRELFKGLEGLDVKFQNAITRKAFNVQNHNVEYRTETNEAFLGMPVCARLNETRAMPVKTKLWTCPLAMPDSKQYEPSVLSMYDPRNETDKHPYFESLKKWNHQQPDMDEEEISDIMEELGEYYADLLRSRRISTKVLTKTEAINSGVNWNIVQLNRDSSPGFPWFKYGAKVKKFLTDKGVNNEAYYAIDDSTERGKMLHNSIDSIIDGCRLPGCFPNISFLGTLKDEPLKLKKIYGEEGPNTRSFAAAPLDYTIASRMYFGPIIGAMNQVRDRMPVQIGIDASGLEWNSMISHLMSTSSYGIDTDFKGWDSTLPSVVKKYIYKFYNKIAQECDPSWKLQDDVIRENLCYAEVKPKIMCLLKDETIIVQAPGGEPSGSPRTAPDNSICHMALHCYVARKILRENKLPQYLPIPTLLKYLNLKVYGDDGMMAVHPVLMHIFNFSAVAREYANIGMTCTPAAKGDIIMEHIPILKLEFLKRQTVKIGKYYFGQLLPASMEKMLSFYKGRSHNWYSAREDYGTPKSNDLIALAQSALYEAVLHGKEYYTNLRRQFLTTFCDWQIEGDLLSYQDQILTRELPISSI